MTGNPNSQKDNNNIPEIQTAKKELILHPVGAFSTCKRSFVNINIHPRIQNIKKNQKVQHKCPLSYIFFSIFVLISRKLV